MALNIHKSDETEQMDAPRGDSVVLRQDFPERESAETGVAIQDVPSPLMHLSLEELMNVTVIPSEERGPEEKSFAETFEAGIERLLRLSLEGLLALRIRGAFEADEKVVEDQGATTHSFRDLLDLSFSDLMQVSVSSLALDGGEEGNEEIPTLAEAETAPNQKENEGKISSGGSSTYEIPESPSLAEPEIDKEDLTAAGPAEPDFSASGPVSVLITGSESTPSSGDLVTLPPITAAPVPAPAPATNASPTAEDDSYVLTEDNAVAVSALPGLTANDRDPNGDTLSVTVATGPAYGTLSVQPDGSFTYQPAADYSGTDSFTYSVSDGYGGYDSATVSLRITAIEDAPTLPTMTGGTVSESAQTGEWVGTVQSTDADAGDRLVYSLLNDAGGRFVIDSLSGAITVADSAALDYETDASHGIVVQATDTAGLTSTQSFSIALTDDRSEFALSAVIDSDIQSNIVLENALIGTAVGITAFAFDSDASDSATYSLSNDAGGRFTIDALTGVISVANSALLDFESTGSHSVTVLATSSDLSTSTQSFTIDLTDDTNEFTVSAIVDNDLLANSVSESALIGAAVGITAFAFDSDASDSVTYSLSNDAGGRFTIDALTGVISVANGALLDFESTGSHSVTVLATSSDLSTSTQSFTIDLTDDTNEFTVSTIVDNDLLANSVSESALNGTAVGITAFAFDSDASDSVTYSLSNDAGGRFIIDALTGVISVANSALLDFESTGSHSVTVLATSSDLSTSTQSFTIDLTDDTSEFTVSAIVDNDLLANSVSESALNGTAVGITAFASDDDASDSVTYSLSDDAGGRFTIDALTGVISVANGALLDFESTGSHSVTVLATSSDLSTSTQSFTIDLTDDTSEFTVSAIVDNDLLANSVSESALNGTAVGITAFAFDSDASDSVTYSLSNDAGGRFTIDALTGVIAVANSALLDFEATGSHSVTVLATSSDLSTSTQSFTIDLTDDTNEFTVSAIADNDPVANTVMENAANGTAVGITALATDDDAGDAVTYSLSDDAGGRFTIDPLTGVISVADTAFISFADQAFHTVTVLATSDDFSTSTQTFTIDIGNVNDAPLAADSQIKLTGGTVAQGQLTGSDADAGDTLTYSLVSGPAHGTLIIQSDGSFSYTPDANFLRNDFFTYQVTDSGGLSDTATVYIDHLTNDYALSAGVEFQVNSTTVNHQSQPSVTHLKDGGFVVVWESASQDGSNQGVYGQRFDASGAAVGGEFQVNTQTVGDQHFQHVTALADGGFVVAWEDSFQDGSGSGIYAQDLRCRRRGNWRRIPGQQLHDQ